MYTAKGKIMIKHRLHEILQDQHITEVRKVLIYN